MPSLALSVKAPHKEARRLAVVAGGQLDGHYLWVIEGHSGGIAGAKQAIELPMGSHFIPEPPHEPKYRFMQFLGGSSGCGKSTLIGLQAVRFHELHPDAPIVLISNLKHDDTLAKLPYVRRLNVDTLLTAPIDMETELAGALVIFDDIEALPPAQEKAVQALIEQIATQGRHSATSMLYASHSLTNYKKTRLVHMEVQQCVVYPSCSSYSQLKHLLGHYYGLDNAEIKRIRKLPSRWCLIKRDFPPVVVYDGGAYLPHEA
jgi:hypothetical protein